MNTDFQSLPLIVPISHPCGATFQLANVQTFEPSNVPTWQTNFIDDLSDHRLNLAKRSQRLACQHIHKFYKWYEAYFGQAFDPNSITHHALSTYREYSLETEKVMARTWNSRWWALNILCEWAGSNAMQHIAQKNVVCSSDIHRRLTDQEYNRLHEMLELYTLKPKPTIFEYHTSIRDRAAALLMLEAGLRVDEVSQADKSDLHILERSGWILVRHGKGEKERKVPLNDKLRTALTAWLELRQDDNPALFDGRDSLRISTRTLQRIIEDLRGPARIPDLRCHSLRYDFAKRTEKRLIKQGYGRSEIIRIIMKLLGHRDAQTTEDYLYSSMDELQSAVEGVM
jgi:integrase